MEVGETLRIPVVEETQVGEARRQIVRLAEGLGMPDARGGKLAVVATELAGNLVKHAGSGGELLVRAVDGQGAAGIEIVAIDQGPGMDDVSRCLRDGFSTTGTAGTGLGAVSRMADLFQVHSLPGVGTAVLARMWVDPPEPSLRGAEVGVVQLRKQGQEACGDAWAVTRRGEETLLMVVDGLGHGPGAAEASKAALDTLERYAAAPGSEIVERAHEALRATRGAAVAIAEIDPAAGSLRYVGIGNIAGLVIAGGESRSMVSHNGIVGHQIRRVQEFVYPWTPESLLVMHSDGLNTRWDLEGQGGLASRHPSLIAAALYRDFSRGTDDVTVAVARDRRAA